MSDGYRYLHTMLRVGDLQRSVKFYTELFGMKELRRRDVPDGKYTLVVRRLRRRRTSHTVLELTYNYGVDNYDIGTAFGHLAIGVPDVYARLREDARRGDEDHARAGAGEVRHHGDRLRRGPGRLQDRTRADALRVPTKSLWF